LIWQKFAFILRLKNKLIIMNIATLPLLNDCMELDPSQVNDFRKNGHTLVKGVLKPDEVPAFRSAVNKAAYAYNAETRNLQDRDTYGKAFLQVMNLWEVDEEVKQFTLAKRFAKIAADLLGVEHVRIYHDQALFKEPGGGFTPWHQDQYYWPLSSSNTITMWMPLIDIDEEMGMLTFASTSHKEGFAGNLAISDDSEMQIEKLIKERQYPVTRSKTMDAGDATWHYGWTLHNAPGNLSGITREVMTIIYYGDGAIVTEPKNEHQENDRKRWLDGIVPGEKAASKLNPLAF
jgi:ectoine hydroxylase-related dioxygenase (phytanoyl-CoA dioxygenase family)